MKEFLHCVFLIFLNLTTLAQVGEWTWMNGDSTANPSAVWGIQGVPDSANTPQGLYECAEWRDLDGNFWLFGGIDLGWQEYQNAMWKYNPLTLEWTWISGSQNCCQDGVYGVQGIPSTNNYPGSRKVAATWVDLDGNFWLFGGEGHDKNGNLGDINDLWRYNPATGEWIWMKGNDLVGQPGTYGIKGIPDTLNTPGARHECPATWVDSNGSLWFFGGNGYAKITSAIGYLNDLWRYIPATNEWTWMSGSWNLNETGIYGSISIPDPSNKPGGRCAYTRWRDCNTGDFWLFGGFGLDVNGNSGPLNDMWRYDLSNDVWTWMNGSNIANDPGIYSSLCDTSSVNIPRSRFETRSCWTDQQGKFWMIGGATDVYLDYFFNDLWTFDPDINKWMGVNGSNSNNPNGHYGIKGISNPYNVPKGKAGGVSWVDLADNLWYFGGIKYPSPFRTYNDMWKFVIDPLCSFQGNCVANAIASNHLICEKFCINFFDPSVNNPTSWSWLFPGGDPSSSTAQNPSQICYQIPGMYDVTLITTNANGNDTLTLANYITVYPTPPFPAITQIGYTLTSSTATSYQWQFNSVDIPGATNQSYDVQQSGYYTVFITDQNGCVSSTTTYILIEGIEDVNSDSNVLVYPNPSNGNFMVELLNCSIVDHASIKVYNTLGQVVFSEERNICSASCKMEIDLRSDAMHRVAAGVYLIEI